MSENILYCTNCGEDENIAYLDNYADGEWWKCKNCGDEFRFRLDTEKEEFF